MMILDASLKTLHRERKFPVILALGISGKLSQRIPACVGYLKSKETTHICSVSFGLRDITTWGYSKYITEHKFFGAFPSRCPGSSHLWWKNIYGADLCRLTAEYIR